MLHARKYSPFVALAFGFLFTIAWITAITWLSLYLVTSTTLQMFSLTVTEGTRISATLSLFAAGLGALGLLGWRRKRKAVALAA
jgi:glycerol-3-phosphate acyltransferase PlsY